MVSEEIYYFSCPVLGWSLIKSMLINRHSCLGPIIRITPHELHVDDYTFWDTLYVKHPKSHKYDWLNGRFGNRHSIFTNENHKSLVLVSSRTTSEINRSY
jgi:hypothetical protein